jgi:ferric-dicitrate binding protein FerR (iron transport regulator)
VRPRAATLSGAAAEWLIRLEGQTTPRMWDEFQARIEADRRNEANTPTR